ncbi:MAG: hypothetical protein L3J19_05615 [Sulfurimonas sp.]|nr:hypothetical protein [Sulfurimonas sp.]
MKYYRYKDENSITCILCKHYCTLKKDRHGICGVNINIDSKCTSCGEYIEGVWS